MKLNGKHMQTAGDALREQRNKQGRSLQNMSDQTKIRVPYLQALESGDYASFSSTTHIKGFLQNYAKALGLDQNKILALYRREQEPPKHSETKKEPAGAMPFGIYSQHRSYMVAAIGIFTVLLIVLYIGNQVSSLLQPPTLNISDPIQVAAGFNGVHSTSETTIIFSGSTQAQTVVRLNNEVLRLTPDLSFTTSRLPLGEAETVLIFTATNQFGRTSEIRITVVREQPKPPNYTQEIV
jgi:cytoskeletal protein RodZ